MAPKLGSSRSLAAVILLGLLPPAPSASSQSRLPQVELEAGLSELVEVKARMKRALEAIPNYTCAETIRRTQLNDKAQQRSRKRVMRTANVGKDAEARAAHDFSDTVSLEVAVVDGAEIYSWPGAEFKPVPLAEIIGFGLVGSGSFSSFAKSLFVTSQGRIRYAGREQLDGSTALRYDYSVSLFRSGYVVTTVRGKAKVGYEGSFWARDGDKQLLRLEVQAVDIPPPLGLRSMTIAINYEEVPIGDGRFELAASTVHEMTHWDGTLTKNETTFHNCREFGATAALSFEVADPELKPDDAPSAEATFEAPVGSELRIALVAGIRSESARVGDRVEARLRRKLTIEGKVVAEKGALLVGRLRRIHRVGRDDDPYFAVSLEFTELQSGRARATLRAKLVKIQAGDHISMSLSPSAVVHTSRESGYGIMGRDSKQTTVTVEEIDQGLDDVSSFYVRGPRLRLKRGLQMTWQVVPTSSDR